MPTVDKVWNFGTDIEGFVDVGDSAITIARDGTGANTGTGADAAGGGSLEFLGAAAGITERARTATGVNWEGWGVPASSTVTDVQVIAAWKKRWDGNAPTASISMRVVDSGAASVHSAGDLLTTAAVTGTDALWTNQGPGTSRAVDSGKQASTTDVRFEVQLTFSGPGVGLDIGNDAITLRITYTAGGNTYTKVGLGRIGP